MRGEGAWEILIVGDVDINDPELVGPPELDAWVRFVDAPDDPATDQALVAYSTDGFLIGTAMRPHAGVGQAQAHRTLSTGVLSHTLTFHEPCPAAEWHLLQQRSSYAGHGRSYGQGDIFRARRAARRVLRPGRHDPRPLRAPPARSDQASRRRASWRASQSSVSCMASCTAAAPGTSRYAWGRPAITWSSQATPAWLRRWA